MTHIPIRECIGCGKKFPKSEMLRIVCKNGVIRSDPDGKAEGRGAYLCKRKECAQECIKRKKLHRAFRMSVDEAIYRELTEGMTEDE